MNETQKLIIRLMGEQVSLTIQDVVDASELAMQSCHASLESLVEEKHIEKIRVGHQNLYGLTAKGRKALLSLPKIDPNERPVFLVGFDNEYS